MQRCLNCKAEQLDGTIFCSECGANLTSTSHKETTNALGPQRSDTGVSAIEEIEPMVVDAPVGMQHTLIVIASGRRIALHSGDELLVGRKDNARGIFPDVDLGLDGGFDAGVSRRHARILLRNGGYVLEDLGSANGTFVNGRRLGPQAPAPIHSGDEIAFGTLILRFEQI